MQAQLPRYNVQRLAVSPACRQSGVHALQTERWFCNAAVHVGQTTLLARIRFEASPRLYLSPVSFSSFIEAQLSYVPESESKFLHISSKHAS